jgi:hypothetical protein
MRNFRGDRSQAEYAENVGKQKTVIGRLESPAYAGWSVRTMLEIARKEDVAVIVRFVDFPTFLRFTGDLSEQALRPASYNQDEIHDLADDVARLSQENALKGLFSSARLEQDGGRSAREALPPPTSNLPANDEVQPTHRFGIMPR